MFTTHRGAALDAGNVRKMFKRICTEAGIGDAWTPRELRTSFVSLMSHRGVSIEEIARLVGHASTRTTEVVYPARRGRRRAHDRRQPAAVPDQGVTQRLGRGSKRDGQGTSRPLPPESHCRGQVSTAPRVHIAVGRARQVRVAAPGLRR